MANSVNGTLPRPATRLPSASSGPLQRGAPGRRASSATILPAGGRTAPTAPAAPAHRVKGQDEEARASSLRTPQRPRRGGPPSRWARRAGDLERSSRRAYRRHPAGVRRAVGGASDERPTVPPADPGRPRRGPRRRGAALGRPRRGRHRPAGEPRPRPRHRAGAGGEAGRHGDAHGDRGRAHRDGHAAHRRPHGDADGHGDPRAVSDLGQYPADADAAHGDAHRHGHRRPRPRPPPRRPPSRRSWASGPAGAAATRTTSTPARRATRTPSARAPRPRRRPTRARRTARAERAGPAPASPSGVLGACAHRPRCRGRAWARPAAAPLSGRRRRETRPSPVRRRARRSATATVGRPACCPEVLPGPPAESAGATLSAAAWSGGVGAAPAGFGPPAAGAATHVPRVWVWAGARQGTRGDTHQGAPRSPNRISGKGERVGAVETVTDHPARHRGGLRGFAADRRPAQAARRDARGGGKEEASSPQGPAPANGVLSRRKSARYGGGPGAKAIAAAHLSG